MPIRDPTFTIGTAMAAMPMSSDHLRKLFEQAAGQTSLQYLTNLRMNEAKQLLQMRAFTIKEVARRCGYVDPYYFSRIFYQSCGLRPSAYAKKGLSLLPKESL